jgi:membrane protease YdiL (CAAX protease family)
VIQLAAMGAGVVVEMVAWRLVAEGRGGVWRVMTPAFVALGVAAVLTRPPVAAAETGIVSATLVGALAGVLLYAGTRAFVALASAWPVFRRETSAVYGLAGDLSAPGAAALAVMMVIGEELFWRGLVQARLADAGALAGAAATWLAFVAVNATSGSLPIVAGAVVGGAVWAGLAAWTGGILASLLCHAVWTSLMILRPPLAALARAT